MKFAMWRNPGSRQRPPAVTWLAGSVFLLGIANLSIVVTGIVRRSVFEKLQLSVALPFLIGLSGLWAAIWIGMAWGLYSLKAWARIATPILFVLYEVITIGQQVVFAQEAYVRERLGFVVVLGALLFGVMILILTHPRVRKVFDQSQLIDDLNIT